MVIIVEFEIALALVAEKSISACCALVAHLSRACRPPVAHLSPASRPPVAAYRAPVARL